MSNGISDFSDKVQGELNQRGAATALSIDEQEIVQDFVDQELGPAACAEQIMANRSRD